MSNDAQQSLAHGWPEENQFNRSILWEFALYVCGVILILMAVTGYIITDRYVSTVTETVAEKLLVQARSYSRTAGKSILSPNGPDALMLNNICKRLAADNRDIFWAGIAEKDGRFIAHTDIGRVAAEATLQPIRSGVSLSGLRAGEQSRISGDTVHITIPILENDIEVGTLAAASSAAQITAARNESIVAVASITIIMILLGIPVTLWTLHRKLRPVSTITSSLKRIDFDQIDLNLPIKSKNEFGYLAETLRVMGDRLNLARQELLEKDRIAREMEIAREIQNSILPQDYPRDRRFEFCGAYRSAREVGGDYYDFIEFDERHLGVLVADVSGKSLPGMLVMLLTRDMVRKITRTVQRPDQVLCEVNRELGSNIKRGMFVTMFFGLLDKATGNFSFASAGHNPLVVLNATTGETRLIKTKGYPLGMMKPEMFEQRIELSEIVLTAGDWVIQYTDGFNEAQNEAGEDFGMDRFLHLLKSARTLRPHDFAGEVLRKHQLFVGNAAQYDDITLLAMKWGGQSVDTVTKPAEEHVRAH
ncbi:SpoIIE family protein phosphatase [candidate division GN15 bacterium]|nr:SpoIIE family protein phosphatase [candidate division GN15 bacterium]